MIKKERETVEMLDGRVYSTDDGWKTVYVAWRGNSRRRLVGKHEADEARFLAIAQSRASADD